MRGAFPLNSSGDGTRLGDWQRSHCPKTESGYIHDRRKVRYEGFCPLALFASLSLPPHPAGRFVLPQSDVNRVAQEVVGGPCQIGDLSHQLRLNPVPRERTSGEPKRVRRGGGTLRGDVLRAIGSRRRCRRDLGIFIGGNKTALRKRRVVVGVDQIVQRARMVR